MRKPENKKAAPEEQKQTTEQAWLENHLPMLWPVASFHYEELGRGAVIIDTTSEEALSDSAAIDTRVHYAGQTEIAAQPDEASQRLARLVAGYDPERELVAVFIRPNLEVSMYQMGVGEELVRAIKAANLAEGRVTPEELGESLAAVQAVHEQFGLDYQRFLSDIDSRL